MRAVLWVLRDRTPGHINQTAGLSRALESRVDCIIREVDVPLLEGIRRLKALRAAQKGFVDSFEAVEWLRHYDGADLLERFETFSHEGDRTLVLGAGTSVAPYVLALAKATGSKSAVCMVPGVLGVKPFDMAIVPAHDRVEGTNVLVTLGAPNGLSVHELEPQGRQLLAEFPPKGKKAWAVAFGGDDADFKIGAQWMGRACEALLRRAEKEDACLYVTTSRRTSDEAEAELINHMEGHPRVSMIVLARRDQRNPIPGMMGCCDLAFTTGDSVNMVSECATAGLPLVVLEVPTRRGLRALWRWISRKPLRVAYNLELFLAHGLARAAHIDDILKMSLEPDAVRPRGDVQFNEARRAARWMADCWLKGDGHDFL